MALSDEDLETLLRVGLIGVGSQFADVTPLAPAAAGHVHAMEASEPDILTSHVSALALKDASRHVPGPAAGGGMLDRPVGIFLFQNAQYQSLAYVPASAGSPYGDLRPVEGQGHFHVGGVDLPVRDYLHQDPDNIASHGQSAGIMPSSYPDKNQGHSGIIGNFNPEAHDPQALIPSFRSGTQHWKNAEKHGGSHSADLDFDTQARDLAILIEEHSKKLSIGIESFDEATVETSMTLHGRKVSVSTNFEAVLPDNAVEKEIAKEHAKGLETTDHAETQTKRPGIDIRSFIKAKQDEQDRGLTR